MLITYCSSVGLDCEAIVPLVPALLERGHGYSLVEVRGEVK